MFSLFKMPKRKTFGHFLTSVEDKLFFIKKEDLSSKKRTYGNSNVTEMKNQKGAGASSTKAVAKLVQEKHKSDTLQFFLMNSFH